MFSKLVAIEPVSLIPSAEKALQNHAKEVILYPDIPQDDDEIVRRIGDADAVPMKSCIFSSLLLPMRGKEFLILSQK